MKKIITMMLILSMSICLSACGKSEEIKNVEAQISTLSHESTYRDIYEVFSAYSSLEYKEQEKVDNKDVLGEYCDTSSSDLHFVLNENMIEEIEEMLKPGKLGIVMNEINVQNSFIVKSKIENWSDISGYSVGSEKQTDAYTYTVYGTCKIADLNGNSSSYNVNVSYFAKYDEETNNYKITNRVEFIKKS